MMLFTAIDVPDAITERLNSLKSGVTGARWITEKSSHITLTYMGEVTPEQAGDIDGQLSDIARLPFDLEVSGVGVFGGSRPRALWAGLAPCPDLFELQAEIARKLRAIKVHVEARKFTPHVTLARLSGTKVGDVANYLARHGDLHTEPFHVEQFALMSSRPSHGGGPYVTEAVYSLHGGLGDWDQDFDADPR